MRLTDYMIIVVELVASRGFLMWVHIVEHLGYLLVAVEVLSDALYTFIELLTRCALISLTSDVPGVPLPRHELQLRIILPHIDQVIHSWVAFKLRHMVIKNLVDRVVFLKLVQVRFTDICILEMLFTVITPVVLWTLNNWLFQLIAKVAHPKNIVFRKNQTFLIRTKARIIPHCIDRWADDRCICLTFLDNCLWESEENAVRIALLHYLIACFHRVRYFKLIQ